MKARTAGVLVVSVALLAPAIATGAVTKQGVRGRMDAVAEGGSEAGRFRIGVVDRPNDAYDFERLEVAAKRLDTTQDASGNRPAYDVWLVNAAGDFEADFGTMRVSPRGSGAFRFDTRRDVKPEGVDSLRDFGGGTIEVRTGDTAVLRGSIPEFVDPDGDNGSGAGAVARAATRLRPTNASGPEEGAIEARMRNRPGGTDEDLRVQCVRLRNGVEYEVVAIDSDANETRIGTFRARGRLGIGQLILSTRRGDTIPGGGLSALGGQDVEVRDPSGSAVLTGRFPDLQ